MTTLPVASIRLTVRLPNAGRSVVAGDDEAPGFPLFWAEVAGEVPSKWTTIWSACITKSPFLITTFPEKTAVLSWSLKVSDSDVMTISASGVGEGSGGDAAETMVMPTRRSALVNPHADIAADPHFSGGRERIHALARDLEPGTGDPHRLIGPHPKCLVVPPDPRSIDREPAVQDQGEVAGALANHEILRRRVDGALIAGHGHGHPVGSHQRHLHVVVKHRRGIRLEQLGQSGLDLPVHEPALALGEREPLQASIGLLRQDRRGRLRHATCGADGDEHNNRREESKHRAQEGGFRDTHGRCRKLLQHAGDYSTPSPGSKGWERAGSSPSPSERSSIGASYAPAAADALGGADAVFAELLPAPF